MRVMVRLLLVVVTSFVLLMMLTACGGSGSGGRTEITLRMAQSVDDLSGLFLEVDEGSISVSSEATDSVIIKAELPHGPYKGGARLSSVLRGSIMVVTAKTGEDKTLHDGSYKVIVPPNFSLFVTTDEGSIAVHGHEGAIKANVSRGSVAVSMAAVPAKGEIDLRAAEGSIALSLPKEGPYDFEARTTEGSVEVAGLEKVRWDTNEELNKMGSSGPADAETRIRIKVYNIKGSVAVSGK